MNFFILSPFYLSPAVSPRRFVSPELGYSQDGIQTSKFEARNPKFETNPKVPNSNDFSRFAIFEFLNFEFVSDFDIRISDFSMPQTCMAPALPA
jgi:hypothetical protein